MPHDWIKMKVRRSTWNCTKCDGFTQIREGLPNPNDRVTPDDNVWLTCEEMQAWRVHAS
jgi:hypothetical protein